MLFKVVLTFESVYETPLVTASVDEILRGALEVVSGSFMRYYWACCTRWF